MESKRMVVLSSICVKKYNLLQFIWILQGRLVNPFTPQNKVPIRYDLLYCMCRFHNWSINCLRGNLRNNHFYILLKRALIFLFKDGDKEVSQIQFLEPEEALKMHSEEKIWLAPPQFYELSRLAAFESYQDLKDFSQERAENFSVEVWFPVQYLLKGNKSCNLQIHIVRCVILFRWCGCYLPR